MFHTLTLLSALAVTIIPTSAHSWIEEYQVIGPNGSYIGDRGFSRGYIGREDPTFDGSFNSLWLLPPDDAVMPDGTVRLRINSTDPVCRASQSTRNYTNPAYPPLKAAPGDYVAMKYLENGHVTLPWNNAGKPPHAGTVYVFGTETPIENQMIADVMEWTADGKGGNGKGRLLTTQNFDDSRCHQINDCTLSAERQGGYPNQVPGQPGTHTELWCESDVKLPEDITSQFYTTYWVWSWPTGPTADCSFPDGKDQYYTTCADHEIIARAADDYIKLADAPATNTLPAEDFTTVAVSTYTARTAFTTYPVMLQNWANFNAKVAQTANAKVAAYAGSCATAAPVATGVPPACPADKWATGALYAQYTAMGAASARSASSAWKAGAGKTPVMSSSAPAASPSGQPIYSGSPPVTGTRIKSVITSYYTSTVTLSPTQVPGSHQPGQPSQPGQASQPAQASSPAQSAPPAQSSQPAQSLPTAQSSQPQAGPPGGGYATVITVGQPSRSQQPAAPSPTGPGQNPQGPPNGSPYHGRPHRGPPQQQSSPPGNSYATVTTASQASESGSLVGASALVPGHALSTRAGAAPAAYSTAGQESSSAIAPAAYTSSTNVASAAAISTSTSSNDLGLSSGWTYTVIDNTKTYAVPIRTRTFTTTTAVTAVPADFSSSVGALESSSHSGGSRDKTGTAEMEHVRTTVKPVATQHANGTYHAARIHPRHFAG